MLKSELIEKNKNLIQQNGELLYLLEFGKLRCEDSKHQMFWEHDSNARVLQYRIDKAIEYIKKYGYYQEDLDVFCDDIYMHEIPELFKILKGEPNNE